MARLPPRLEASPLASTAWCSGRSGTRSTTSSRERSTACTKRHSSRAVQNVHAMRPEVREDYERGAARGSTATRPSTRGLSASSPSCATRSWPSTATTRASRRSGARCSRRSPRAAAARDAGVCARSTTSARSPRTGCSASRPSATSPTSTASRARCSGVRERLPYLRELGVSYLHLMPLLHARPEPNDGGYAVLDYGAVEPALGTMDDLRALAADLRAAGIALCVDVVLNHTAQEHPWARAALGRRRREARLLPDLPRPRGRPTPTRRRCPRSSPTSRRATSAGCPSSSAGCGRRSTTYQWDLDYTNPEVFRAMAEVMLDLAAVGVDVLRLDAVPFLWKRMGTNSQNQPEVHELLQAFRTPDAHRRAGGRLQGRGDRLPARPRRLPGRGAARGQGVRPRLPQRAHGAAVERAGLAPRGAAHEHPARHAARCRPAPAG